jgi:TatD DNase family protein
MLIDTHCHLDWDSYQEDLSEVLAKAEKAGVEKIVTIGVDEASNAKTRELVRRNEIYRCVGYHPDVVLQDGFDQREINRLMISLEQELLVAKTVGIGECGLDYYRLPEGEDYQAIKQKQKDAFISQIKLAQELDKTLVIHTRSSKGTDDACLDVFEILTSLILNPKSEVRFVLHSYTGSAGVLQKFLDLGGYVSFNGIITFDKTGNMERLVQLAPLEKNSAGDRLPVPDAGAIPGQKK